MILTAIDWIVILVFFLIILFLSWIASKSARKSTVEYFLANKSMPWWLLGISMVATTFSADTPNLVTGFVREGGIAKNWFWWSFLVTGMITVFIYSKLWRKSGVLTDLEFYELRYGGKASEFLRGFRAVYLGLFFNCLIMASVMLAAIKISTVLLGLSPLTTVVFSSVIIVFYSALGGLRGVIWTDFFQFTIAMIGAIYAAYICVNEPEVGGLSSLLTHEKVTSKLSFVPNISSPSMLVSMFIIPLAVQWWSVWYPGSEPGGGGYIAQRMLAAKNESHAQWAVLFFNFAHYALRPWPWILVALASIVVYPSLESIAAEFPHINAQYLGHDVAYPIMLTRLDAGWLGLVVAALISAFMSTISTHLNWGASYLVHDFYNRFVDKSSSEKKQILVARISICLMMTLSGTMALTIMENASQAFNLLLLSGAGTGTVFLLRWFWMRISATTEILAKVAAFVNALLLTFLVEDVSLQNAWMDGFTAKLLIATVLTTLIWVLSLFFQKNEPEEFENFSYAMDNENLMFLQSNRFGKSVVKVLIATIGTYTALFGFGQIIYGEIAVGVGLLGITTITAFVIFRWK